MRSNNAFETGRTEERRAAQRERLEIAGCGHAPALNTPEQYALVERFFAGARSTA